MYSRRPPAYKTGTISTALVQASSVVLLAETPQRRYAIICNTGGVDCYLAIGQPAVAGSGIMLKANGGTYEISSANLTTCAISAVTAGEDTGVSIQEGI